MHLSSVPFLEHPHNRSICTLKETLDWDRLHKLLGPSRSLPLSYRRAEGSTTAVPVDVVNGYLE